MVIWKGRLLPHDGLSLAQVPSNHIDSVGKHSSSFLKHDSNSTNHNSFKTFLWNGTIYFSNFDALNIFNGIQAISLSNILGEIDNMLFIINIKSYFSLIIIDDNTCSIKKRSPKNNRHIIIFRHFKHNKSVKTRQL